MVATHTIELGELWDGWDGQWVKIKPWMSFASEKRIAHGAVSASHSLQPDDDDKKLEFIVDSLRVTIAYVQEQIVEWNLLGYDGEPLPQGRAGVMSDVAPPRLIDAVIDAAGDFYEAQSPPLPKGRKGGSS